MEKLSTDWGKFHLTHSFPGYILEVHLKICLTMQKAIEQLVYHHNLRKLRRMILVKERKKPKIHNLGLGL